MPIEKMYPDGKRDELGFKYEKVYVYESEAMSLIGTTAPNPEQARHLCNHYSARVLQILNAKYYPFDSKE